MDRGAQHDSLKLEQVFRDYKGRRAGLIKALTTDVNKFYELCDPRRIDQCLWAFPDEQWEVSHFASENLKKLSETRLGINLRRDMKGEKEWVSDVAALSDAWLLSIAFYEGTTLGFDQAERKHLFDMINKLPTIYQVVAGNGGHEKQVK